MAAPEHGIHVLASVDPNPKPESPLPPKTYDVDEPIIALPNGTAIRRYRLSDADNMEKYANNIKIIRNMTNRWPNPYTLDKVYEWIIKCRNEDNWIAIGPTDPKSNNTAGLGQKLPYAYAITLNDELIGGIGVHHNSDVEARSAMLGYWLAEEYWGCGYMTGVGSAFVKWVWNAYPWIVKLEAGTYGWNPASGRVLEKCGFEVEGRKRCAIEKYGVVGDMILYGMVREGVQASSEPPAAKRP